MSEKKDDIIEDMSLEGDKKEFDVDDMSLEGPEPEQIEAGLRNVFPGKDSIKIEGGFEVTRMASGEYRKNGVTPIQDLKQDDLDIIENYIKDAKK